MLAYFVKNEVRISPFFAHFAPYIYQKLKRTHLPWYIFSTKILY